MKAQFIPGWLLMTGIAVFSGWISHLLVIGGKTPLEASAVAVVLGILAKNSLLLPKIFEPGIKAGEKLLVLGIVLMGASLDYSKMLGQGHSILIVILGTMIAGFLIIFRLGTYFMLPPGLTILLAVGTTICGGTAVAITAPLIKAKEEETSYAVATIALWGIAAILFYPAIGAMIGASDFAFGLFAGTAIHSTPQVVGAAFIYSEAAGKTATAVKLVRNCFMAPLALLIALWWSRRAAAKSAESERINFGRAFPWFLFAFFGMSWLGTNGFFAQSQAEFLNRAGRFLILLGMAGVGLNTSFGSLKAVGLKPLVLGFIGAVAVAGCSAMMITALF